jgi:hypothetical protein
MLSALSASPQFCIKLIFAFATAVACHFVTVDAYSIKYADIVHWGKRTRQTARLEVDLSFALHRFSAVGAVAVLME